MPVIFAVALALALLTMISPSPATAQADASLEEVKAPTDVFVLVGVVRSELELVRLEMGRPTFAREHVRITDVAPREVYFQALNLFRKANRLCYEHSLTEAAAPAMPKTPIGPSHVYEAVDAALTQIRSLKSTLNIPETVTPPPRDESQTPTDVFRSIVLANQQLDRLLDRRYAPSDVYEQVTLAVGLASHLLARFPEATRIGPTPDFERRKNPTDVYDRLVRCFGQVHSIAGLSGIDVATLARVEGEDPVTPSDVYSMALLTVSELSYFHSLLPDIQPPVQTYYPGRKSPSHVYQRVGILEAQLSELEKHVRANPRWIGSPGSGP